MKFRRDNMGYINLEKLPIKEKKETNILHSFTFLLRGKRYHFKEVKEVKQSYNELIGYEIAKDFGLEAVPYDLASYDGHIGFLSEDYMQDGYVCMEDLLIKYYGSADKKNNLDDVSVMLRDTFSSEEAERIINDLVGLLMFDIIIGNYDRHEQNIIIDTKNGKLAPVSDNEMMLDSDAMYSQWYGFRMNAEDKYTLDSFLGYLDSSGLVLFANKALIIQKNHIQSILNRVEKKIGHQMNEYIRADIEKQFSEYSGFLLRKIEKEVESRWSLTKSR